MRLLDVLREEHVCADLTARTRPDAIRELVGLLAASGAVPDEEAVAARVWQRELPGSTGLGKGVAVPHAKWHPLERTSVAVGVASEGIDWEALDGEPVRLVFLIVSPADRPTEHLRALRRIFFVLREPHRKTFLLQCRTRQELFEMFRELDEEVGEIPPA